VNLSANTPRRPRLGLAVAALATTVAVALPSQAVAAPTSGAKSAGGVASRAAAKGHRAKASKDSRNSRTHRAPAKTTPKPPTTTPPTGGSASGGGSTGPTTPPATTPPTTAPPSTGPNAPPSTGTTTPPSTGPTTPPSTGTTTPSPPGTTAPPPATTPPSTNPGSELLFSGSRIRDFGLLQEAPNAITEVPDPLGSGESVLKMTVNDKDVAPITPTDNPRAQALSPDIINQGQEFWLSTKFLIPSDFPTVPGWMSLVSIYGAPFAGSSPWQVEVVGNNLQWARNASYGWDVPWQTPFARGQWTTILLHEKFASNGFVEMWVNGAPVNFFSSGYNPSRHAATQHLEMKTVDSSNNGGANAAKIMQYRKAGMFQTASVYFGALKVGASRASVGG
jgi:hypothetical protein